jgi:hypothetical protein
MSLDDIVTNIASECGYSVSIGNDSAASNDTTAKQIVAIANRLVGEAFDTFPWWQFDKSYSFQLVDGQSLYPVPGDFSSYHFDTFWNQSTRWRLIGPMSPQDYGELQGFGVLPVAVGRFQLRGVTDNQLFIYPTPDSTTDGSVIVFQYISNRPVRPWTWTASTSLGTKLYTFYNGNYYSWVSGTATGTTPPTHTSGSVSDGGVTWAYYDGAYEKFRHGSDISIIKESIIEQGVLERFGTYKQMTIPELYDLQLNEEYSQQMPSQSIFTATLQDPKIWAMGGRASFRGTLS